MFLEYKSVSPSKSPILATDMSLTESLKSGKELINVKSKSPKLTLAFKLLFASSFTNCTICFLKINGARIIKIINTRITNDEYTNENYY